MRNLKLLDVVHVESDYLKDCSFVCVDTFTEKIYATSNECVYQIDKCDTQIQVSLAASLKDNEDIGAERLAVGAEFLVEHQSVCVPFDNGDLVLFHTDTLQVECVGVVTGGIQAIACSPEQELLVILTGNDTLLLMTKDFDPVVEKNLNPEDYGENKPITVGWGTKETQFHGSEGKAAAALKNLTSTQEAFAWDDRKVRVSWRGDGRMFVVSSIDTNTGSRKLRIWDRELSLLCTGENVNGLEQALYWKPSGSVIVSTQRSVNKHEVIFFEKNGLRHGEFPLPFQPLEYQVKDLAWNGDSSVLAVWGCTLPNEHSKTNYSIMLWTVNNYHWYQKQTLDFGAEELRCVFWDPIQPYILHGLTAHSRYFQYRWNWTTNCNISQNDVAVIHGCKLLVTPLQALVIPPPLSAYHFQMSSPINQVIFSSYNNDILLLLADNSLALFQEGTKLLPRDDKCKFEFGAAGGNGFKVQIKAHLYIGTFSINWKNETSCSDFPLSLYHWTWLSPSKLMCVASLQNEFVLVSIDVIDNSDSDFEFHAKTCFQLKQRVLGLATFGTTTICLQTLDGAFLQYNAATDIVEPWLDSANVNVGFPQPCETFEVCEIAGKPRVFGLTGRFRLFCNEHEVANDCTSFRFQGDFLLTTSFSHTLRCFLKDYDLPKILSGGTVALEEAAPRNLERGSRIVAAVHDDTKVVLQMPRGNLETIHPRILVLSKVRHHLESLKYTDAFAIMRKHRINLNLLYDDNSKRFEENIITFVNQLDSAASINMFLNELTDEDTSETMYAVAYRNCHRTKPNLHEGKSKRNVVCEVVRAALLAIDRNKYFLSILTTYAKTIEPQLDLALMEIKKLQGSNGKGPSMDEALRYLMYMVDVNVLYNVALGTYDFDVVLMVAEKSQKDPKEYVPFLNDLKNLEPQYQKFKIDTHLHNYKKALSNISQCGETHFDELLTLVKNQRLYTDALFLFPLQSKFGKILWRLYGDYLMEKKHYEEAGLAYDKCECYQDALEAHKRSLDWQMALCASIRLGYTQIQTAELCKSIAGNLRANRMFIEAANLYEHYVQDIEESIATLLEGQEWSTALNMIYKHGRQDLLETHLKPQLLEQSSSVQSAMDQMDEDFVRHNLRLQLVREDKERQAKAMEESEVWKQADADLFSDTSSVTGRSESESTRSGHTGSIATKKTSRRKKQRDLKKYSLKEGSAHEDLALVVALSELVKSADQLQETMSKLLKMLVVFNYFEDAKMLQKKLEELLSKMQKSIPEIWPPEPTGDNAVVFGPSATANSLAASLQNHKNLGQIISDPLLRTPPTIGTNVEWKLFLLGK